MREVWFTDQLAEELHKPVRHHFPQSCVQKRKTDEIWAVDLVDKQSFSKFNDGVKYLLTVIDGLSKYGWIVPLKDKTGESAA
jgi:hypothetical protein